MKLSNLSTFTILSFINYSTVYAKCYDFGAGEYAPAAAVAEAPKFCSDYNGDFPAGKLLGGCRKVDKYGYDVYIKNTKGQMNHLDSATCVQYLINELACPKGGETNWPAIGWKFASVPKPSGC
ncbi:hypothetical protein DSL72_004343 [Monilinia vaccinii-corymbosi]|uniref:Secreted protein n=1 Tax=Monilinia vaccinii-corymbosi TaxID=61207 RepID=A0A8A3NVT8_9HELO|nr:hypothetical protein DSL72_004343 [Monilinia vaccinii-corymbosi]